MTKFQPRPFGKYYLLEKLATGGMAEIYKAKTYGIDGFEKILALKKILPHCSEDEEFIQMLIDEAKLSVLLTHTNIVQIYDLGKVGDDYFISMEYIQGANLREILKRLHQLNQALDEDLAIYLISESLKGLEFAHSKKDTQGKPLNIVHRDVSPQNILVSYEGEVKIVDFGIAKAALNSTQTRAGILKGKIHYMSPEQAFGKSLDGKSDLYAAGLVLYELLTGDRFFDGETHLEILKKIQNTKITKEYLAEKISSPALPLLAKALSYHPENRYKNAGEFQVELTRYLYQSFSHFNPNKLAGLMRQIFTDEIKFRHQRAQNEDKPDTETRALMARSDAQQNIVHRSAIVPQRNNKKPSPKKSFLRRGKKAVFGATALTLMLIGSGFAYLKRDAIGNFWISKTNFQIESQPSGAEIFFNGKPTQKTTPSTLEKIKNDQEWNITLKKHGFEEWHQSYNKKDKKPNYVKVELNKIETRKFSTMKINSTPAGAKIFLDGRDTGKKTPSLFDEIPLHQKYLLRLELPEHKSVEQSILIATTEPNSFDYSLTKIKKGTLQLTSDPEDVVVEVFYNNKSSQFRTPVDIAGLEVGKKIKLSFRKLGFQEKNYTIALQQEGLNSLKLKLDPNPLTQKSQLQEPDPKKQKVQIATDKHHKQVKPKPNRRPTKRSPQPTSNPFVDSVIRNQRRGGGSLFMP